MRVEIDVIGLASDFLRPVLHFAFGDDVVAVAAFVGQMLSPVKLARESAFAFFASIPSFSVVAKVFLFSVFGERATVDENLVTGRAFERVLSRVHFQRALSGERQWAIYTVELLTATSGCGQR